MNFQHAAELLADEWMENENKPPSNCNNAMPSADEAVATPVSNNTVPDIVATPEPPHIPSFEKRKAAVTPQDHSTIELKDLSEEALKTVMDLARNEVLRTAVTKGHCGVKVDYRGESVLIGHIIKYLPVPFRFKALHGGIYIYIYYIHPQLRIENCRFRSGKGARPLWREH